MGIRVASITALAFAIGALATACGKHPALVGYPFEDADAAAPGDGSAEVGFSMEGGSGDAGGCPNHCSTDLHTLRDCHEKVLLTCPDDKGCANDTCVDPCGAARLNGSAQGCEFYSAEPAMFESSGETDRGACFAAMLANTWTQPITLQADYAGSPLPIAQIARTPVAKDGAIAYEPLAGGTLAPGQMALLFLSGQATSQSPCPEGIVPGVENGATLGAGRGKAFHITTSAPAAAYDIFPYGGAKSYVSSATLLLPTSAWGRNFVAVDAYPAVPGSDLSNGTTGPFVQIVAAEDDTHVSIDPVVAIIGGKNVEPSAAHTPHTYTLARGEILQLLQRAELAGSPIESDKAISVWGGHSCANIPFDKGACDSAHQQILPIRALGSNYVAAAHRDRTSRHESTPWTLTGTVDGTKLEYEPSRPLGAPSILNAGETREFKTSEAFRVSSDGEHPFHLGGHMTGGGMVWLDYEDDSDQGDPDYVNAVPPEQWLPSYVFLTDWTYKNTHLVFIRKKAADDSFKEVQLDCIGTVTGWTPLAAGSAYEIARVDLDVRGTRRGTCTDGVHTAKSEAPFGLTVWGWDAFVSYAYPAGMGVRPLNSVVVPVIK